MFFKNNYNYKINKVIDIGLQNKYIISSTGYINNRSYLTIDLDIAQGIVDACHGTPNSLN